MIKKIVNKIKFEYNQSIGGMINRLCGGGGKYT